MQWDPVEQIKLYAIGHAPENFLADLTYLGFTQAHVARETGHTPQAVSNWAHARRPIPKGVLAWLRQAARIHALRLETEYLQKRLRVCLDRGKANGLAPVEDPDYDRNLAKRSPRGIACSAERRRLGGRATRVWRNGHKINRCFPDCAGAECDCRRIAVWPWRRLSIAHRLPPIEINPIGMHDGAGAFGAA